MPSVSGGVGRDMATLESPNVGKLLLLPYPFRIPDYQRPFAWTEQQLVDYVGDLTSVFEAVLAATRREPVEPYFFGAVITLERKVGKGADDRVYEIVDGQQRMTAFMLTISELRRAFFEAGDLARIGGNRRVRSLAASEHAAMDKRLFVGEETHDERDLRLTPGGVEVAFYRELVTKGEVRASVPATEPSSHDRLNTALRIIRDELVEKAAGVGPLGERVGRLSKLREAVLDYSYVIHASSSNEAEAYRLFLSLNDRGTPLSEADLLRTRTMEVLREYRSAQGRAARAWDSIIKAKDPRRFLQAYYAMETGKRPASNELHRQYLKQGWLTMATKDDSGATKVADFADELARQYARYAKISVGQWPYTNNPGADVWDRDRLNRLIEIIGQASTLPLLMSLSNGPEDRFVDAVRFLERYALRYVVCRGHPSRLADLYIAEAQAYRMDPTRAFRRLVAVLRPLSSQEAPTPVFRSRLTELTYRRGARANLLKHLLTTLDDYDAWYNGRTTNSPAPTRAKVWNLKRGDVDHIYPQTPRPGYEDAAMDIVRDRLGNLTFLEDKENRATKNSPFATKQKTVYARAGQTVLTGQLSNAVAYPSWDIDSFNRREADLLDRCEAVFRI